LRRSARRETAVLEDRMSPDGLRVVMSEHDWREQRREAAALASDLCEVCPKRHFLPYPEGQLHHRLGRGGGRRDDRRLVPMQTVGGEPNLARWRWFRNLLWVCGEGHATLERVSTKEYRRALLRFCECGLLSFQ
jgi:hypothetical protein